MCRNVYKISSCGNGWVAVRAWRLIRRAVPERTKRKIRVLGVSFAEDLLEDLLAAAVNDAVRKVEAHNRDAMADFASGINLPPGFKMPF